MDEKQPQVDLEDKHLVVISPDDAAECAKFFEFFEIPVPPKFMEAIEAFKADPSFLNQCEIKYRLAEVISKTDHPVFRDEVFAQVLPETSEKLDEMLFERELERQLTVNPK